MTNDEIDFQGNMKKLMIIGIVMIIGGGFSIIFGVILIGYELFGIGLIILGFGLIFFGFYVVLNWVRLLKESLKS